LALLLLLPIRVEPAEIAGISDNILPKSGVPNRAISSAVIDITGAGAESANLAILDPGT
jgi:hypothetical protein